ncbi:DUF1638 domain-containing protein [Geothrix sp. 21YS21S-2]|uniref:DUF1638 domain-containing protein n=1 Tax=Geothrix sp. 21YS21S-2 TaxID=3068893 RepID=UPI0027BA5C39|nr:DUF1638 domain-containing protein [Geothrix sp. 21YS21S-2]
MSPGRVCLSCSIFRREIQALQAAGRFSLPVDYLSSMLHMNPGLLEARLRIALEAVQGGDRDVVLVYGDCCGHMEAFAAGPGTARTEGLNCCEIVLGRETYRKLRREGAFFLMPEWTLAWKRVFEGQLGLLGPCAKAFMQEMHTRLIYLDTGVLPVPHRELEEAGAYMGLPVEILPVSLEPLRASLELAAGRTRHD